LLYVLRGSLPWQGTEASTNKAKYKRIGEKKQQTTSADLCAGFPAEFAEGLQYIRSLGFKDQPDYNRLQGLLSQVLTNASEVDDGEFDWVKVGEESLRKLEIRPSHGPVADNAPPPTPSRAIGITGKRPRTDSVPDPGQTRAQRPLTLLHRIADADAAR
jgi:casein kinase 1